MSEPDQVILIVDDDKTTCLTLGAILKRMGHKTAAGGTCSEARELFEADRPKLIFLDIELGQEDGTKFCEWVRAQEEGKDVPIIMGTSHNEREYIVGSIAAGANDFIIKPYNPLQIKERVEKHLGK